MVEKKVTIYTLAEELGMSASAVSRAFVPNSKLSQEKREIILAAAKKYGFVPNKVASRLPREPIYIGVLIFGKIRSYYTQMIEGIRSSSNVLYNYKVFTDLRILNKSEYTTADACDVLDEFAEKKYNAVILNGVYDTAIIDRINRFAEAGIDVVMLNHDIPDSRRLFASVGNTELIGSMTAQLLSVFTRTHSRTKNVVVFTGSLEASNHIDTLAAFQKYAKEEGLHILETFDTQDIPYFAEKLVAEAFMKHSEIDGIYVASSNSLPICRYIKENKLKGRVSLVTTDVFPEIIPYIQDGIVDATIFQDPFQQGKKAFDYLYEYITEKKKCPSIIVSSPQIVLKSNLSLFSDKVK